jgi:hypothetical protein
VRHNCQVNGREQASRARVTGEPVEEDDIAKSVGNSLVQRRTDKERRRAISLRSL